MTPATPFHFIVLLVGASLCGPTFGFSYESLVTLIGERIRDVPTLLGELPKPLVDAYVGISITGNEEDHSVDSEEPRIFIFDDDGKFLLTYDSQEDSRSVQIAQYRDTTDTLELRQITFPRPNRAEDVGFSKPDPKSCLKCHQSDARWIWQGEYPHWIPGLIGRHEDGFAPDSPSLKAHLEFKRKAKNHKRHQHLGPGAENSPHPFHIYDPKLGKNSPGRSLSAMPNTRLTMALNRLNARRVFKLLKRKAPLYAKYRHALAYAWSHNLSASKLAPPGTAPQTCFNVDVEREDDRTELRRRQLDTIANEIVADYASVIPNKKPAKALPEKGNAFEPENIFYILGLDMKWDVSLGDPKSNYPNIAPLDYWDGLTDLKSLLLQLVWRDLTQTEPELAAFSNFRTLAKVTHDLARNEGLAYYRRPGYFPPALMATFDALSLSMVEPRLGQTTFLEFCDKLRIGALTDMGKSTE